MHYLTAYSWAVSTFEQHIFNVWPNAYSSLCYLSSSTYLVAQNSNGFCYGCINFPPSWLNFEKDIKVVSINYLASIHLNKHLCKKLLCIICKLQLPVFKSFGRLASSSAVSSLRSLENLSWLMDQAFRYETTFHLASPNQPKTDFF